jgi:hypothetical protein
MYASFLRICAPCIWSFFFAVPLDDFLQVHKRINLMNNNLVQSIKLTPKGTYFGKQFIPLTPQQALVEKTWEHYLDSTLGPELKTEEMEALEPRPRTGNR